MIMLSPPDGQTQLSCISPKNNKTSLPKPHDLYFYGFVVFDTGCIFDFDNIVDEAEYAGKMVTALNEQLPNYNWFSEGVSFSQSGAVDMFTPPKVASLLGAKLDDTFKYHQLELKIKEELSIICEIDEVMLYCYIFNTGVMRYRLRVPTEYWQDLSVLKAVRNFIYLHNMPLTEMGINTVTIFNPIISNIRQTLQQAIADTKAPLLHTPFLDFAQCMGGNDQVRWSHSVCVVIMPPDFDPKSQHFQKVLLDVDPNGIRNFAMYENHFVYTEASNSLICAPDVRINGRDAKTTVWETWVRYIRLHQYTWKMAWELDRGMHAVLNTAANHLKNKDFTSLAGDSYELNALLNYVTLTLDAHQPRNVASAYYIIHYIEGISSTWMTQDIIDDLHVKMLNLKEIISQFDELSKSRRSASTEKFLAFVGVFGLGSLVLDYLKTMSFGSQFDDITTTITMIVVLVIFTFLAIKLMR